VNTLLRNFWHGYSVQNSVTRRGLDVVYAGGIASHAGADSNAFASMRGRNDETLSYGSYAMLHQTI
jgi:hypothetical protein